MDEEAQQGRLSVSADEGQGRSCEMGGYGYSTKPTVFPRLPGGGWPHPEAMAGAPRAPLPPALYPGSKFTECIPCSYLVVSPASDIPSLPPTRRAEIRGW